MGVFSLPAEPFFKQSSAFLELSKIAQNDGGGYAFDLRRLEAEKTLQGVLDRIKNLLYNYIQEAPPCLCLCSFFGHKNAKFVSNLKRLENEVFEYTRKTYAQENATKNSLDEPNFDKANIVGQISIKPLH